jgi:hypothetical protein
MRGRRPGITGGVFAGIHGEFFRAENDADGRRSFAAVERSMSDRLLRQANPLLQAGGHQQTTLSIDNDGLDIRQLFD